MEEDNYILTPWNQLSPEAQETIRRNQATQVEGKYIDPSQYENSSFYTDRNGNIAKGADVDNWIQSTQLEGQKMVKNDSDYFSSLWKGIDETWGSGNPIWGAQRISNFNKALDSNPGFMDNWQLAQNIGEGVNVMTGGLLNRLSPTQNARMIYDWYKGNPIFIDKNGQLGSWWGNSGVVSNTFAKNHPYASIVINGVLDARIPQVPKAISNLNKVRRMESWYTGVPHKLDLKLGVFMDENFPNYNGSVWTSNSIEYARGFGSNYDGINYKVYVDPKDLRTLSFPRLKHPVLWDRMPFNVKNGKVVIDPRYKYVNTSLSDTFHDILSPEELKKVTSPNQYLREKGISVNITDDLVNASKENGFNSTRFHNVLDGPIWDSDGNIITSRSAAVDELILEPGVPRILMPENATKFDVLKSLQYRDPSILSFLSGINGHLNTSK